MRDRESSVDSAGTTDTEAGLRRRRLGEVFGDVLPDTTSDELRSPEDGSEDEALRREVPPHHG